MLLRHVTRIDEVFEMTIASDPAYVQTSVTAREVEASGIVLRQDEMIREAIEKNETAYAELRK